MLVDFKAPPIAGKVKGLPQLNEPEAAMMEGDEFSLEDVDINLRNVIGSGVAAIVFGSNKWVVRIGHSSQIHRHEIQLTQWASGTNVGPRFHSWGQTYIEVDQLERIAKYVILAEMELPLWLQRWMNQVPRTALADVVFVVTERWDFSLKDFLKHYGSNVSAFQRISFEVISEFSRKISLLHNLGVVHADIQPKNILVRQDENGKATAMCIIDFGLAFPRDSWFFELKNGNRDLLLNHYLEEPWVNRFSSRFPAAHGETATEAGRRWLLNEPFHFDWLVVIMYETLVIKNTSQLTDVPYFNFNLNWDSNGMLAVEVVTDDFSYIILVHGFENLASLRKRLSKKFDVSNYVFKRDGSYVAVLRQEEDIFVSEMIDSNKQISMSSE